MSTKCQIGFYYYDDIQENLENWRTLIYRRYDGNPKSVLPDLIRILKEFGVASGDWDSEYLPAFLVSEMIPEHSIGISKEFHADLDFYYAIFPDKIKVFQCRYHQPHTDWKLIKSVKL